MLLEFEGRMQKKKEELVKESEVDERIDGLKELMKKVMGGIGKEKKARKDRNGMRSAKEVRRV